MDNVRYYLSVLMLISFPPAVIFWYFAHGFVQRWRAMGLAATYSILLGGYFLMAWGLFLTRGPLLSTEYGGRSWLYVIAGLTYSVSIGLELRCRKHLKTRTLVGVPEIRPDGGGQQLLQDGIYGRMRHPRYLSVMFGGFAGAAVTNYLAIWILMLVLIPGLYLVTVLEERELIIRFGEQYIEYQGRVPRFIPRKGS